jgi:predicted  nucleic acid-binding Zn-ribbon protein
MMDNIE